MNFYINPEILNDMDNPENLSTLKKSKGYLMRKFKEYEMDCQYGTKILSSDVAYWVADLMSMKKTAFENIPTEIQEYM